MTILGLIRHGETDWNAEGRVQGQSDIPLNVKGLAQAEALARRLAQEDWDHLYASDLSRAYETARAIARLNGLHVTADPRLREVNAGEWEGLTLEQRVTKWGDQWSQISTGQETPDRVVARAQTFLEEICRKHPDQRILIVSHGAWLGHTIRHLLGARQDRTDKLRNTAVSIVRRAGEIWTCERYNCIAHLQDQSQ